MSKGYEHLLSAGAAATSLVSSYYPWKPTAMGDFDSAMSRATQLMDLANRATDTITQVKRKKGVEDEQYVAAIRNCRSRYGKKRRQNLRNAWLELNKDKRTVWSRFQTFKLNGFADALGPFTAAFVNTGTYVQLPVYCFRLTSFPQARVLGPSNIDGAPMVMYALTRSTFGSSNAVYTWQRVNSAIVNNERGNGNQVNTWDVYKADGESKTNVLHGFRHKWTDIKMTFYPQTKLPCDWTVRLVKFKDGLTYYPPGEVIDSENNPTIIYNSVGPTAPESADVTMMWDSYFGGKILHPHNTQPVSTSAYGKYPFVPLRTEKVYVPAREQTTNEAPTRVLYKHFFQNDRHYDSRIQSDARFDNPSTVGSFTYIDENKIDGTKIESSPLAVPQDEVWLMVEATGYKTSTTDAILGTPTTEYPTFDICMKNCHSYQEGDLGGHVTQYPEPLAKIVDPIQEPTKETENVVNETTEV